MEGPTFVIVVSTQVGVVVAVHDPSRYSSSSQLLVQGLQSAEFVSKTKTFHYTRNKCATEGISRSNQVCKILAHMRCIQKWWWSCNFQLDFRLVGMSRDTRRRPEH